MKMFSPKKGKIMAQDVVPMEKIGSGCFGDVYKFYSKTYNRNLVLKCNKEKVYTKKEFYILSLIQEKIHREFMHNKGAYVSEDFGVADAGVCDAGVDVTTSPAMRASSAMKSPKRIKQSQLVEDDNTVIRIVRSVLPKVYFRCSNSLAIEYINGNTLRDAINSPYKILEKHLATITIKLLIALSFLHSHGIFHRDIKPDNIMFRMESNDDIEVKLIDFGLSIVYKDKSASEGGVAGSSVENAPTIGGTPIYTAPEMFNAYTTKTEHILTVSDIYSLGITLIELINKKHPIQETHMKNTDNKVASRIEKIYNLIYNLKISVDMQTCNLKHAIESMVNFNCHFRPTAAECLELLKKP